MPAPDFSTKLDATHMFPNMGEHYPIIPRDWFEYLSRVDDEARGHKEGPRREFHYISLPEQSFLKILRRFLKPRMQSFIDVGCGGGDKLAIVKQLRPDLLVHGVEHDPTMAVWASLYADKVFCADAFTIDYSVYDLIYAYWPIADQTRMLELVDLIMTTKKEKAPFVLAGFYSSNYGRSRWICGEHGKVYPRPKEK